MNSACGGEALDTQEAWDSWPGCGRIIMIRRLSKRPGNSFYRIQD